MIHTIAILLALGGVASIAFGVLATLADGMSDTPGANSGGCTFVIGGAIALAIGIVGILL